MKNKVLFYFWAHSELEELMTQTFEDLVDRVDVLFLECVTSNLNKIPKVEEDLTNCSQNLGGYVGSDLDSISSYMLNLTKGTKKRYVLERSLKPEFDEEEDFRTSAAFFECELDKAMKIKTDFLAKSAKYQKKREKSVAKQILAIKEKSLVLFGSGHLDLEKKVRKKRPTEVHFPYSDYPILYKNQMWEKFKETKKLDKELYLRFMMEQVVRKALDDNNSNLTDRVRSLVTHSYAGFFSLEQIQDYANYLLSFSDIMTISKGDIFEAYLKINDMPLIREVLEKRNI